MEIKKKLRKDFDKLRHKFSKTEIKEYREASYITKKCKSLSISKIEKTNKSLNKFLKSLRFKKFNGNLIVLIMKILIIMMIIMILPMMMNTEQLEALEHYLKSLIEIITNQ